MQKKGTVIRWDATRAFGFIRGPDTSTDVFFHVRDCQGGTVPREGLAVVYEEIHVGGKGPRAMAVRPSGTQNAAAAQPPSAKRSGSKHRADQQPSQAPGLQASQRGRRTVKSDGPAAPAGLALFLMIGWVALLGWGLWAGRLPLWVLGAAVALNLLTFLIYAIDKSAAQTGRWRTKESHLHMLSLVGGWPGAWFAQQWVRHKSRKAGFRGVYWATVVVHCAAMGAWLSGWIPSRVNSVLLLLY